MYLLNYLGHPVDFEGWFFLFAVLLIITNSCINPFIYAAKYRRFQEGVKSLIKKIRPGHHQSQIAAVV